MLFNLICKICDGVSVFNSGVTETRASSTGAIAVITPESGLFTTNSSSPSFHLVRIDKESLPTGTDTSRSTQHFDNASTPSLSEISSISSPVAAIQLADT